MKDGIRSLLVTSVTTLAIVAAPPAWAVDKHACLVASDAGQADRIGGKLLEARSELLVCADATCPEIVRAACAEWLTSLDAQIPTIVAHVHEPTGEDVAGVRMQVDGRAVEAKEGSAVPIDPGPHRLRFVTGDGRAVDQDVVVDEGQKLRTVDITLPARPSSPSPEPASSSGTPWAAWGATAVAGAAWLTFAGFAISGHVEYRHLESTCGHSCDESQYPSTKFIVADVALGVAIVATGAAAILFLVHGKESRGPARSASFSPGFRF